MNPPPQSPAPAPALAPSPGAGGGGTRSVLRFLAFLVAVTLLFGTIGGYAYWQLREAIREDSQRTLTLIAEQKRQQIEALMSGARGDLELFTTGNTLMATQLVRWIEGGRQDPVPLEAIRARMGEVAQQRGWLGFAVFDAGARPVIAIGEIDTEAHLDLVRETLGASGMRFVDLHRHGEGPVQYGLLSPIATRSGAPLGVLHLTWAAARALDPLVESWPVPTRTAETFLVRREGQRVRFLTPLRHRQGAALTLDEPLSADRLPAVAAAQGRHGLIPGGVDYRGAPVLAYTTPVADTPWAMVAKIDEDEAFARIRSTTRITALVVGWALLAVYGSGWLLWRRDRRRQARAAAQAQQAAETRFHTLFELSPLGVALADLRDGRVIEANPRFAAILGRTPEELTTADWMNCTHPDDQLVDLEQKERLSAGEIASYRLDKRYLRPDGSVVWVSLTCGALQDDSPGGAHRYLAIVEDVTERVRIEDELRWTAGRLEAMFSALPDLMFRVAGDGRIEEYHSAANDLLYVPPSLFLGRTIPEVLPAPAAEVFMAALDEAAIHGTHRGATYWLDMPQGRLWFELSIAAMGDADLPDPEYIVVVRDITERKEAEEALRSAEERALAASRAKSEFLAHMSHEIRTPLNGVLGLAQVLARGTLTDHQRSMVERIRESGESLLAILNDILDFSKIEAGQLRLETRPFELGVLLARVDSLMGRAAVAKGLGLRLEAPAEPLGRLLGDPLRLEQVLVNLVGNAVKFTAQGEVAVRVAPCLLGESAVRLRFEVSDTGIGIEPGVLAGLFTPFTQADAGISRHYGGTGLGLSICKRLVELMDGEIGATSEPGQGSLFWCELPFARAPEAGSASAGQDLPPAPDGPRLAGLRLLVVDDSAMNRDLVERALALEGAIATEAADGQQAIQLLKARPMAFDAVLMDVRMPVMDGLTATRLIRHDLGLTALPVIALTAGVMAEEREAARAAGMDDLLAKPLDLEQLVDCLLRCGLGAGAAEAGPPTGPADPARPLSDPGGADALGHAEAAPPLDPTQLDLLRQALARNQAKARRLFSELEPALRTRVGAEVTWVLGRAIRDLHFEAALGLLERALPDGASGTDQGVGEGPSR